MYSFYDCECLKRTLMMMIKTNLISSAETHAFIHPSKTPTYPNGRIESHLSPCPSPHHNGNDYSLVANTAMITHFKHRSGGISRYSRIITCRAPESPVQQAGGTTNVRVFQVPARNDIMITPKRKLHLTGRVSVVVLSEIQTGFRNARWLCRRWRL